MTCSARVVILVWNGLEALDNELTTNGLPLLAAARYDMPLTECFHLASWCVWGRKNHNLNTLKIWQMANHCSTTTNDMRFVAQRFFFA